MNNNNNNNNNKNNKIKKKKISDSNSIHGIQKLGNRLRQKSEGILGLG